MNQQEKIMKEIALGIARATGDFNEKLPYEWEACEDVFTLSQTTEYEDEEGDTYREKFGIEIISRNAMHPWDNFEVNIFKI